MSGNYENTGNIAYIMTTNNVYNLKQGQEVHLNVEYLSGGVTGGGRVIFMWDLCDSAGNLIQRSEGEPTISQSGFDYKCTINSDVSVGYFKIAIWRNTDSGGNPYFNGARFRILVVI